MRRLFERNGCLTTAVLLVLVVIGAYMLQARTTKDGYDCWHAHFDAHVRKVGPRYDLYGKLAYIVEPSDYRGDGDMLTFLRHHHRQSVLGYCADYDHDRQPWTEDRIGFEVHIYEPSDRWPDAPGSYIFVKHTDEQLFPIYVGYTDSLKETLRTPHDYEKADCIDENGATHIHARLADRDWGKDIETDMVRTFRPPCNGEYRDGDGDLRGSEVRESSQRTMEEGLKVRAELVKGHVVSWTGKSGARIYILQ